ncbi:hypothetical protein [Thermococcus prieurii]
MNVNIVMPLLIIALVFTSGCISGHEKASTFSITPVACPNRGNVTVLNGADNITANSSTYKVAVELMEKELGRAKEIYRTIEEKNGSELERFSNFTRLFLSDSRMINETAMQVGNETYGYVLLFLHEERCGINFRPESINVSGLHIQRLPPNFTNGTRTYTGIPYTTYAVRVRTPNNELCKVYFSDPTTLSAPYATVGDLTLIASGGWLQYGKGGCGNFGEVSFRLYSGSEDVTVYLLLFRET